MARIKSRVTVNVSVSTFDEKRSVWIISSSMSSSSAAAAAAATAAMELQFRAAGGRGD
jgi:hypothetical protein